MAQMTIVTADRPGEQDIFDLRARTHVVHDHSLAAGGSIQGCLKNSISHALPWAGQMWPAL